MGNTIEMPVVSIDVYCDTCGNPLQVFLQSDDLKSIISVCRCEACDHRRSVDDYRRGWEDYKKFGAKVVSQAQERRIKSLREERSYR